MRRDERAYLQLKSLSNTVKQLTVEQHLPSSPTEKFITTQREAVLATQSLVIGDREQTCKRMFRSVAACSSIQRSAGVDDSIHIRRDFVDNR